jgi:hypothetical protein
MPLNNVADFATAAAEGGKHWISTYFKAPPATATVSGQWYDYGYAGGNPIANYYAAAPGNVALLESEKGILLPNPGAGQKLHLHRWTAMSRAAGDTSTSNQNQTLMLCDYLMYYPFIDMDAAGEDQVMTQTIVGQPVSLPRYQNGVGVQMMLVSQSVTAGGGRFTITYVDSDDVPHTTDSLFCAAAQPSGALVQAAVGPGGLVPFVPLQAGVKGVKSVTSINFSVANGGLCAIVLVRPLVTTWLREECRRTTTGTIESFGDVAEWSALDRSAGVVPIETGAFLSILGRTPAGSLASSVLVGAVETIWS